MTLSAFADKTAPPDAMALQAVLGPAYPNWLTLQATLRDRVGPLDEVWAHAGKAYGWSMRLLKGKRVVVYLAPQEGQFLLSVALGEKACALAVERNLAPFLLEAMAAAPRYAEGRGVRLTVTDKTDAVALAELAVVKLAF